MGAGQGDGDGRSSPDEPKDAKSRGSIEKEVVENPPLDLHFLRRDRDLRARARILSEGNVQSFAKFVRALPWG